ncbi:MAG: hypothetical protein Q9195_000571 [Heterodermia aff. obscurata]
MAGAAAVIGSYIALVGPLTTAITQIIDLSKSIPSIANSGISKTASNQINVGVGMYEGGDQDNFGGSGLKISGFTQQGTYIGKGKMPHMDQGRTYGISLDTGDSDVGDVQAWQLTIAAGGSNAVCVQYVELAWQGTIASGFDGTWGQMCGQDWYYSTATWGVTQNGQPYRPACWWLDAPDSHHHKNHPAQEVWANMESFVSGASVQGDNGTTDTYCSTDIVKFSATDNGDSKNPSVPAGLNSDKPGSGPAKLRHRRVPSSRSASYPTATASGHSSQPTSVVNETSVFMSSKGKLAQLVVSDIQAHSAKDLCDHSRSRGPDFVSRVENIYCDMTAKRSYPLCKDKQTKDCFSLDKQGKRVSRRDGTTGQTDALHRDYHAVQYWSA